LKYIEFPGGFFTEKELAKARNRYFSFGRKKK